ncbi:MAG TPA: DUF4870 domain-containing protein [Gammaproteobacteria bacterium]|jgi:hypothetical protein
MTEPGNTAALPGKEARTWAMLCHLLALSGVCVPFGHVLGPLVIWAIKKDEDPFIDDQGKEALNFQLTMTIVIVAVIVLMFLIIGFFLLPILVLFEIVLIVMASVAANEGRAYRYPLAIRFFK